MPRGDKRKYTDKQKRRAQHIEEGYLEQGVPRRKAAARAWATVNAMHGGGEKPGGGGYGRPVNLEPARKGGRIGGPRGGRAAARRPKKARKASARKASQTRARRRTRKARGVGRGRKGTRRARKTLMSEAQRPNRR